MADGFETIGWILSVEDKATDKVKKITDYFEHTFQNVAHRVGDLTDSITAFGEDNGRVAKGLAYVGNKFTEVFGHRALIAIDALAKKTAPLVATWHDFGAKFSANWGKQVSDSITRWSRMLEDVGLTKLPALMNTLSRTGDAMKKAFDEKDLGKAFTVMVKGLRELGAFEALGKTLKMVTKIITGPFKAGLTATMFLARKSVGAVTTLMQRTLDISKIGEGMRKMGGIAGALLGPLAPLMKLFEPLINMIVSQFTPAIQTFSDIVETAFGPFSEVLEIIAQNLAKQIVPLLAPFTSFLELAAVQLGGMVVAMLKGPDGGLVGALTKLMPLLLEITIKLLPVLMKLAVSVLEKIVVPALIKLADFIDKHMPEILDFVDLFAFGVDKLVTKVEYFFNNFDVMMHEFKVLVMDWIEPLKKALQPVIDMAERAATLFGATSDNAADATAAAASAAKEIEKLNKTSSAQAAGLVGLTGEARRKALDKFLQDKKRKKMAGGTASAKGPAGVGIPATIGEAGPEMVLPLNRRTVETVLAPLFPDLKFPALDRLVEIAASIEKTLARGMSQPVTSAGMIAQRADDGGGSALDSAVGMNGVGSW